METTDFPSQLDGLSDADMNDSDPDRTSNYEACGGETIPDNEVGGKVSAICDDGDEVRYYRRIREIQVMKQRNDDILVDGQFRVPACIWHSLFDYQQEGVRWIWSLHCQRCGGILGDEMGLGKTIQIIAFLAALSISDVSTGSDGISDGRSTLIICPTTLLKQWVAEFHRWAPSIRTCLFHSTGSYTGRKADMLFNFTSKSGSVVITSYGTLVIHINQLMSVPWHYVILDEGHRIRNPDAHWTVACKMLQTPHRLVLTGTPMQNNLRELWSLFDFVFPGKLGTLETFTENFAVPINLGGYANAGKLQVKTSYMCAAQLLDIIRPYLLRRMKCNTKTGICLPAKSEQILFCKLTPIQRRIYKEFVGSTECKKILLDRKKVLAGINHLRKLCNHPALVSDTLPEDLRLSGKMNVLKPLLKLWWRKKHRVLLYFQGRKILDIMERYIQNQAYTYLRIDGTTPVTKRQTMIQQFNEDSSIFIFLLTTRVGGVGVNLTGADRVVIFDPDWNPSVDLQARERAWRIGQHKKVAMYRLITKDTIEEKIYHRQVHKQFLTKRVLHNTKQKRFFHFFSLHSLFTLADEEENSLLSKQRIETETLLAEWGLGGNADQTRRIKGSKSGGNNQPISAVVEADSLILAKLLKNQKIHYAVPEDIVFDDNNTDIPDSLDQEARRIAQQSVTRLEASRAYCNISNGLRTTNSFQNTSDAFRIPDIQNRQASDSQILTSEQLLSKIRNNQSNNEEPSGIEFLRDEILEVLRSNAYTGVSSDAIIDHFKSKITSRHSFRSALRKVAELRNIRIGKINCQRWFLKSDL